MTAQILLIEEQPNQRLLYGQELEDEGYDVIATGSGTEGLTLFQKHRPKLVILDILLRGITGIEVMERMLELDPNVAIIVHSAYSSPSHDFVTWFAKAYVVKSGDLAELKHQVKLALAPTPGLVPA